ncbi:SPOR domain-containing protein [Sphingomonas baiyangensis]|uniref:SPOR domain-containing protein n=1 Tax=Sphingomonas baiyangensis TaxID=2572576 RepID=A0A4U1L1F2_9SPHN|nr:SPOR domain-containing protein [Sphingomonas baiyangensis]TKD49943.1 SPOR domain-containing protein [Sphingomonas baiyangensis]
MTSAADSGLRDEDRLPWLETVDDSYDDRPSPARVVLLVLIGLAVIAAAILGIYWYQDRPAGGGGSGELIEAQEGDYKVKPDQPGGMEVAGEGDSVFKTSDGSTAADARVDLSAVPETPVAPQVKASPKAAPTQSAAARVSEVIPPPARKGAPARITAANAGQTGSAGTAIVQLGSFPSPASANGAWKQLSGRFGYLANLGQTVEAAEVNGRTVHRLRVNAGSAAQARDICQRLKVAGEACFVVS